LLFFINRGHNDDDQKQNKETPVEKTILQWNGVKRMEKRKCAYVKKEMVT